jgi:hypothetical protein
MSNLSLHSLVNLNNGRQIPAIGLGVYRAAPGESAQKAVETALKVGLDFYLLYHLSKRLIIFGKYS